MSKSLSEEAGPTLPIQVYLPPHFEDNHRLERIQSIFPEIDGIYRDHAEKNSYPGYAYGILLDGQLVHSDGGGFIDIVEPLLPKGKRFLLHSSL